MTGAVIADGSVRIDSAAIKVPEDTPFRLKGQKVWLHFPSFPHKHISEFLDLLEFHAPPTILLEGGGGGVYSQHTDLLTIGPESPRESGIF
jgi:hypothetical protein